MARASRAFLGLGPHGFHKVSYGERGPAGADRTVVCVHGLTRNGRDFDPLAMGLEANFRVVCPDVVGRGDSDWLVHKEDYGYPQYMADMAALIARLATNDVYWVGTSMGGLIGMMLAAQPNSPIRRLVMNDIGPFIPKAAAERIGSYVGNAPDFASIADAEAYLRQVHAGFGDLTEGQWRHLAEHSVRRKGEGYRLHYDPAIGHAFRGDGEATDIDLWPVWDAVNCPVLVLRGAQSDTLLAATAQEMTARGPKAQLKTIEGVGHAPALMDDQQIALVRDWLMKGG